MLCDRKLPHCNRCVKAGRRCTGYGTRLSWPRRNDPRRAIVGPAPARKRAAPAVSSLRFVNASSWDIELFQFLSTSADLYGNLLRTAVINPTFGTLQDLPVRRKESHLPLLKAPSSWVAMQLKPMEKDLFQYCLIVFSPYRCLQLTLASYIQSVIFDPSLRTRYIADQ